MSDAPPPPPGDWTPPVPPANPYAQPQPASQWPPPPASQWPPPPPPGGAPYYAPYAPPTFVDPLGRPLAEWWKRLVAYLIDSVLIAIPLIILFIALLVPVSSETKYDPITNSTTTNDGLIFAAIGAGILISLGVIFAYHTILTGNASGQTLGKKIMKLQVRDATTGGPIGYGRAFIRYLVPFLGNMVCNVFALLDGLWPLWDGQRQAIHDKIATSVVIDVS